MNKRNDFSFDFLAWLALISPLEPQSQREIERGRGRKRDRDRVKGFTLATAEWAYSFVI